MGKSKERTNRRRYGRSVPTGEVSQDPAKGLASAPPNLGRPLIPQIITFSGRNTAWTNIYKSPDEALNHSRSNARHMRNDPSIMECLEARQRGTALLNWHVDPEDKKDPRQKQLVEDVTGILEAIPQFTEYRRNLLEALWYGRYANQNKWGYQFVRGTRRMTLCGWRPIHGDKLLFRYDDGSGKYDDNDIGIRVGSTFGVGDIIAGDRVLEMTDWGMGYFLESWERPLLCVHKHIIEDGAFEDPLSAGRIHGVGIRDRIYWCWFQKQETMAHLMEVIERTGTGFTIYYYPYGNPEGEQKMRDVAEQQTKNNVLLIPRMSGDPAMDAYGIDRIEPSSVGIDALKSIIHEFFGHQIKRYILGQILSTESAATGLGSGVADLHQDTFYGIIAYDAVKLEETLTEQLVRPIVEYNFPWARNIRLRFKIDTEANESDRKLQAAKQAWDMGARLKASDIMDLIGFSVPTEDDEVLQNPSLMQQQRLWDQSHQQPPGEGGAMGDGGGGDFPPGSPEDSFGPLMGLLGQGPQQPEQQPQQYAKQRYSTLSEAVDAAAKESERNPSDAQKEAGNYRKGKVTLHGMPVTIENAKGSRRRPEWPPLAAHYGYINRTEGRDGDHVDVFIGPNPESEIVFVIDQVTEGGRFDEHKCMLGYTSQKEAKEAYLANYTPGWKVGPITALTIPQFKAWLEKGDTTEPVAKQVSRYEKVPGMPASPAEVQQHRVGETKSINGKTYRLNENHRWELAQGNDNETTDVDVSGLAQPEDDHKQRLGFVKKQLSKVHSSAAGIMRALQASPDFTKGAEYATQDVHPKQAAALYQFLQQNAGNDVGGSLVHDFGEGRLGYATPAGSIIVWPEQNGTHRIAYTAKTGIVDRAMTGKEPQLSTVDSSQPGIAETTDIPQESGEQPGAAPAPQTPPAAQVPSDSLDEDDRAFVAQGQQEKAERLANLPKQPTLSPSAQATLDKAGGNFGNTPRGLADKARSAYEDAVQEWENAVSSGADRKTVSGLRAKAQNLRGIWRHREAEAKAGNTSRAEKPQRSPKVKAAIDKAAETLGIAKDDSNPLPEAAGDTASSVTWADVHKDIDSDTGGRAKSAFDFSGAFSGGKKYRLSGALVKNWATSIEKTGRFPQAEQGSIEGQSWDYLMKAGYKPTPEFFNKFVDEFLVNHGGKDANSARAALQRIGPPKKDSAQSRPAAAATAATETPLLDAAKSGQGGGTVPEASPEALAKRKQADAEHLKHRKLRDWENNVGLHLQEAGIDDTPEHREALQKEIDSGRISERGHLESVLRDAKRAHERGDMSAPVTPHLQQAISRRINRAEQERKTFDHAVRQKAQEWGIDESSLRQAVDDAWGEKLKHHEERESAKSYARKITGLTAADINRLENQGQDIDAVKGIDTAADQIASMFPGLGWEGLRGESSSELSQRLWELIREGNVEAPSKTSDEFWDEVGAFLDRGAGGGEEYSDEEIAQMREENEAIPFHRLGFVIRYRKWVQRYAGRRTPRVSPGQKSLFPNTAGTGHNAKWEEAKHPRDHGKFAPKGQGKVASSPGQMLLNLSAEEVQQHKDEIAELRKELLGGEVTPKEAVEELKEIVKPADQWQEHLDAEVAPPMSKMKPEWFHGTTTGDGRQKYDVTKNPDGTYKVTKSFVGGNSPPMHVSDGKDAEGTMNNIWRSGSGLTTEQVFDRFKAGVLKDREAAKQQDAEPQLSFNESSNALGEMIGPREHPGNGSIVADKNGNEFLVMGARNGVVQTVPIVNGKAEASRDSRVDFVVDPERSPSSDSSRKEPLYKTGRNYYDDKPKATESQPKPQTDLLGQPLKPEAKKPDFGSTSGKQEALFDKSGKPGQKNLFADKGVPNELVQKGAEEEPAEPAADSKPEGEVVTEEQAKSRKWTKNEDGTYTSPNGTIWKKAAAGGEVSPVTGEHFKGGSLMPIHGLAQKQPKPEGKGTASGDSKPKEEGKRETRPVQQMSPEMIEAERERRENEARWTKVREGHVGELLGMGERPHHLKSTATGGGTRRWEGMVESAKLSPEQVKELADHFEKKATDAVLAKEGEGPEQAASYLENANLIIDGGKAYWRKGKLKTHPDMPRASHFVSDYLNTGGQGEKLLELHEAIEKLKRGESLKPEGEAEKPASGGDAEAASPTKKEPWQMTSHDFEQSQMGPTYGDWYFTPEGKYVQMRGSGGMGSGRVGAQDIHGNFVGYYNRSELRLANKSSRPSSSEDAADKWLSDVTSRVAELRNKHQGLLLGKGITEQFRDSLAKGKMTQAQFDKALADGTVLSDKEMKQAEEVERQINEIRSTPLTVPVNEDHKRAVQQALAAGHPVPAEVLAEYPDLQEKPAASEQEAEPAKPTEPPATEPETPVESAAMPAAEAPAKKPAKAKAKPAETSSILDKFSEHHRKISDGEATAEEVRQWFNEAHTPESQEALRSELSKKTVAELKKMGAGGWHANGMKKDELVKDLVRKVGDQYHVGESFTWSHGQNYTDVLRKAVEAQTDEHLKKFAERVAERRAEYKERLNAHLASLENPQTLEDFQKFERYKGLDKMTPEQRAKYDELQAVGRREKEKTQAATVSGVSANVGEVGIVEGHHKKRNAPTFTVTMQNRVDRDKYMEINSKAKQLGGSYVDARIAKAYGATPGFQFFDRAKAEQFAAVLKGESADRSEHLEERQEAKAQTAAERLKATAESLAATAEEQLSRERKTNTHRRAGMAANAEAQARADKAKAETISRIAEGLASGEVKHLGGIRAKTHVETLDRALRMGLYERFRQQPRDQREMSYEDFMSQPHSEADIESAKYPYPTIWAGELQKHAKDFSEEPGLMRAAQSLMKAAKSATDVKFKGSAGGMKTNGGQVLSPDALKKAITGSDAFIDHTLKGKHVRVHASYDWRLAKAKPDHHGAFYTADGGKSWGTSPTIAVSGAMNRGNDLDTVEPPEDKLLTIDNRRDIETFATAARRLRKSPNRDLQRIGEHLHDRIEEYNRLQQMDIKTPAELRAALREYLPYKAKQDGEDPVKKKERALIGQKIPSFFPTPRPLVDRMLSAASIQPGHKVLEPSAGKGDILDAIREQHPDVETHAIEPVHSLREILQLKGHNLADDDFTQHNGQYDRIVMNPPFENGQDADHVQHAFKQLSTGGRLVAIMSSGPFSRSGKKDEAFRSWLDSVGGEVEDLPEGSFAGSDAFRQTGVSTKMVVIDK